MTWIDGAPIASLDDSSPETRNAVAMNVFRAWYRPFYDYGVIHGDPHFGNYTVRPDFSVNLMDFGCIRVFPAPFVGAVIDLYKAVLTDDEALAVHAYTVWGFKNLSREMIEALNIWARFLYAPVMDNRRRRIDESGAGNYGREQVQKVHGELKRLGGITPPREFVFMDRAAVGLGALFLRLKADINWYELFHSLIDGFDVAALAERQAAALAASGLTQTS
jgi:predicted unusual protein kinase regulating ubiquinone biosynthesis (AarF/ABC1/UbiB family)